MKKLFTFFAAMLVALAVNAKVIKITNDPANSLQSALNSASTGDIIEMAAGTYSESGNYLAFTGKEVTVRAAEGAEVIIQTVCPVRLKEGAKAEFINVKFDCSTIGSYDYVIVAADDTDNKRVVLTGCDFYGWTKEKAMIEATSSRRLAAITIDSCTFYNCMKSVVFVENTGSIDLSITNSTFANITTSSSFSAGVIDSRATAGSVRVDHCTFYNVEAMNTDYAAIGKIKLPSGAVVSNCIFALSAPGASTNRTIRDKVTAKNCLVYNYTTDSHYGMQGDVTKVDCIIDQDPLFADAANNNFELAETSPAKGTGVGGTHLGDPRWWPTSWAPAAVIPVSSVELDANALALDVNETAYLHATVLPNDATDPSVTWSSSDKSVATVVNGMVKGIAAGTATITAKAGEKTATCEITVSDAIPSTDFAEPYFLKGTKAVLNGNIYLNETDSLYYQDKSVCGTATWKINATRGCVIGATANFKTGSSSGAKLRIVLLDEDENQVGDSLTQDYYNKDGDKAFTGTILIPAAGVYTVKLVNIQSWSSAKLRGVTLNFEANLPKTIYCKVKESWWTDGSAAVGIYAWGEAVAANAEWPGVRMNKVEGQAGVWSFELPGQYTSVVFTRMNPSNEGDQYWGAKTGDQVVPTDEKDIFTITTSTATWDPATVEGAWSVYVPETPAKFYITGNEALVGEKAWSPDALKVTENSYTFENLAVGNYVMKVTEDGSWGTAKGYEDLTTKPAGLTTDKDGNICFKMKAVGNITITYTSEEFTVGGDFYVPVLPNDFYLVGEFNGVEKWDPASITEANRFAWNSGEGDKAEFKVVANLTKGDKLKAVYIYEDAITEWYPADANDYLVTEWTAGEGKTVYFRKDYSGTDWGHNLYIEANEPVVTYSDFEIDLRQGQLGSELQKYLTVGETYVYANEMPIAYNALLKAASFNGAQHGYVDFVATIPVEAGNYKITIGNCSYNNKNGAVKNADGTETLDLIDKNGQTITAIETPNNCYHQNTTENVTSVWFVAEDAQTIQIVCPQYAPYIKVEQVAEVPEEVIVYNVTFAHAEGATGVLPATIEDIVPGTMITLPKNTSMYKEGYTFDSWTDGEDFYDPGFEYEVTDDVTFTAVYAENTVSLAGRTEAVTIKWEFSQSKGVAPINVNGKETFVVAQATIGESKIDVKLPIDATVGKFVNSAKSWTQINPGVIFSIPSAKGAVITYKQYDNGVVTTPEINVSETDATYQLVAEGTSGQLYYEYVQVALPKPTATSVENVEDGVKAQKMIENGQMVIIKNGVRYNAQGAVLK